MTNRAQGTMEYLVIVAVVVVLSLVVVGLVVNQTGSASDVSSTTSKISQFSGAISISEAVVGVDGNSLITLTNNSGGVLTITRISVDGSDTSYFDVSLLQGDKKVFSLGDIGSSCSCVGYEGKKRECNVVVYTQSEYGLENQFPTSVNVDCVSVARATVSAIVQPISYVTTLNVKDAFNDSNLSGINIDCDGIAYDLTNQNSPVSVSFKRGTYSCIFSKTGYSSTTSSVTVNSSRALSIYMSPLSSTHFSDCGTLSTTDGNYVLDNNISSTGTCLTITANNVKIYANGFAITGDINGSSSTANAYTNFTLKNCLSVDGNLLFNGGADGTGIGKTGGAVTVTNSTVKAIISMGGNAAAAGNAGGVGGAVTVTNSTVLQNVNTKGGYMFSGYSPCSSGGTVNATSSTILIIETQGGRGTGCTYSSYPSGAVTITDSNVTTIDTRGGGSYVSGPGGAVTVTSNSNIQTINTFGGSGSYGANGGTVTITGSNVPTILAYGGSGSYSAGAGGAITVTNSSVTNITNYGGTGGGGTTAGNAGVITMSSTSQIGVAQILGYGGNSGSGISGNGSIVSITAPTINLTNAVIRIYNGTTTGTRGNAGRLSLNYTTSFVDTNSFYDGNLRLMIINSYGDVNFSPTITSSFTNLNLLQNFALANNSVYLNSTALPVLNADANIRFNLIGSGITNPQIKKSGVNCNSPDCNVLSNNSEIIIFRVQIWDNSTYTITQDPSCPAIGGSISMVENYCIHTFTSNGTFTMPFDGNIEIYAWGGGGGGGYSGSGTGGGGGAANGTLAVSSGSSYIIVVGGGGLSMAPSAGPGAVVIGGGGLAGTLGYGGQGGGFSGLFVSSATQANAYLIAGGGGGASYEDRSGGAGGGTTGANGAAGNQAGGGGGTQSAGGSSVTQAGSALQGGNCGGSGDGGGGGAGGGGYYGGGAGTGHNPGSSGGGGSGYYNPTYVSLATLTVGSGSTPGDSGNSFRGTSGNGGAAGNHPGNSGIVIIRYPKVS